MCVVSNIGDQWKEQFPGKYPNFPINPVPSHPVYLPPQVTKEEFDTLRREVQELKKLLKAAKIFDEATGQPHCEMDAKVDLIKQIAKLVGVDLEDIFDDKKKKK